MSAIITQMQEGFIEIAEKGEFPRNAKIGVISTSTELDVVSRKATVNGKKVKSSNIVGFKELVNRANILNNPDRKKRSWLRLCEGLVLSKEKGWNESLLSNTKKGKKNSNSYLAGIISSVNPSIKPPISTWYSYIFTISSLNSRYQNF